MQPRRFPVKLQLVHEVGTVDFRLIADFIYISAQGQKILVPKGFKTDLSSIPKILRSIQDNDGVCSEAGVIHDYLYSTQGIRGRFNRHACDDIFREILILSGVSSTRANLMHDALRVFGGNYWGKRCY